MRDSDHKYPPDEFFVTKKKVEFIWTQKLYNCSQTTKKGIPTHFHNLFPILNYLLHMECYHQRKNSYNLYFEIGSKFAWLTVMPYQKRLEKTFRKEKFCHPRRSLHVRKFSLISF